MTWAFGQMRLPYTSENLSFIYLSDRLLYIVLRWYKLSSMTLAMRLISYETSMIVDSWHGIWTRKTPHNWEKKEKNPWDTNTR